MYTCSCYVFLFSTFACILSCVEQPISFALGDLTEEGSSDGSGMPASLTLPRMALYPVQFSYSCETGFEDSLVDDCKRPCICRRKQTYEEIATVSCSGLHLHACLYMYVCMCVCLYVCVAYSYFTLFLQLIFPTVITRKASG